VRTNVSKLSIAGVKLYFLPGTSKKYNIAFPAIHDMYIEQLVADKSDIYLSRFIKAADKLNDFSFFQTTLKAIKFYYGFMSKADYQYYKLFYDN